MEPTNELVYIVDDEANVGEALSTLLRASGKRVKLFTSGQDFLDIARRDSCDSPMHLPDSRSQDAWIGRPGGAEADFGKDFDSCDLSHWARRHPINRESDEGRSCRFSHQTG